MKKIIILTFLSTIFLLGNAQNNDKVILGNIDNIESKILNEQRKVWVYVPDSEGASIFSQQSYPVVYLLDGDAHFYSVVGMIQQLSSVNGNTICPKMIVVGIPNTNRSRDLTPSQPTDASHPFVNDFVRENSGGGEQFMAFMEKELIPYIEANYPTKPYRMLIGHSFGGLTVMNTVLNHTELFNAYISLDPSMWWDNQKLLKEIKATHGKKKYQNTALYIAIANTVGEGTDLEQIKKDTSFDSEHLRFALELSDHFSSDKKNGMKFRSKYYPNDDHGSVPLIAEYDALRFIFDFYRLDLGIADFSDPNVVMSAKIKNHFDNLTKYLGYENIPEESLVNSIAYQLMTMENFDEAKHFFQLNVTNYPTSQNVYDSLGDFYEAIGDKKNAIETYKKALAIKEVDYTRAKLEKLQNE